MVKKSIEILDTTLRDGTQATSVSLTLNDKIRIALALDELGVDYIEGGWPGSNPKDEEFFKEIKKYGLTKSKIAAFGSTRRKENKPENDNNLSAIINADVNVAVIFGKSWVLHVDEVLKVSREENLRIIAESIEYLKSHGLKVIFDAEHFYQGFQENSEYALQVLKTAESAHADVIVLCDTNGGTPPDLVFEVTKAAVKHVKTKLGLHMHNDIGCAVANSLLGVVAGARHVQGTINGIGERAGNADLVQIIPSLILKYGFKALNGLESLKKLKNISRMVYEIIGINPNPYQPYVGDFVFSHKAGVHADAVMKVPRAYEHIDPTLVGNQRRIVISELAGVSNIINYLEELGLRFDKKDEKLRKALQKIKKLENEGYSFDLAPSSAILVVLKEIGLYEDLVKLEYWKVMNESSGLAIAVVKANGNLEVAEGKGPVHAVDLALRRALSKVYPELEKVKLTDYRVVLPGEIKNTESTVRVTIEFSDNDRRWRTMGVSTSVIEASIKALVDGIDYYLQMRILNEKLKGININFSQ